MNQASINLLCKDTAVIQLQATHSHIILALGFLLKTRIMITALKIVRIYLKDLFGIITVPILIPLEYMDLKDGVKVLFGILTTITLGPLLKLSS